MLFRGSKTLVTGGAGFIGSNLVIELVRRGSHVTVIDPLFEDCGGNIANLSPIRDQITLLSCDIQELKQTAIGHIDYIFNLAGQTSHGESMRNPLRDLELNGISQLRFLQFCKARWPEAPVLFTSTRQVYGVPQYLPVDENHPLNPPDFNGVHKLAAEFYHRLYFQTEGLKISILRLTNIYGPRLFLRSARHGFVGSFIRAALLKEPIRVFDGGHQIRDFVFVDDVVEACLLAASQPAAYGKIYNLSGERLSIRSVAENIRDAAGGGELVNVEFPQAAKNIDIGDYWGTSDAIFKELGWRPKIGFKEGIQKTLAFAQAHQAQYV